MREHEVAALTAGERERGRRDLLASLALARPGSPVRVAIRGLLRAIDSERARRAPAGDGRD